MTESGGPVSNNSDFATLDTVSLRRVKKVFLEAIPLQKISRWRSTAKMERCRLTDEDSHPPGARIAFSVCSMWTATSALSTSRWGTDRMLSVKPIINDNVCDFDTSLPEFKGIVVDDQTTRYADVFCDHHDERLLSSVCAYAFPHLNANLCTGAAVESVVLLLTGTAEFASSSVAELQELAAYLIVFASGHGRWVDRSSEQIAKTVFARMVDESKQPIERCIDAALLRARSWLRFANVPDEIRKLCQLLRVTNKSTYHIICVAWTLHLTVGDGWFVSAGTLPRDLRRHGIAKAASERTIRAVLERMRAMGVVEIVEVGDRRRCHTYRFVCTTFSVELTPFVSLSGEEAYCDPADVLRPYFDGTLLYPDGSPLANLILQDQTLEVLSPEGNNIAAAISTPNIAAARYRMADAEAVKRDARGRWEDLYRDRGIVTLKRTSGKKNYDCPCCGKKNAALVKEDGGMLCHRCRESENGLKCGDGFDVIQKFRKLNFLDAVMLAAEYFDVVGDVRIRDRNERHVRSPSAVIESYATNKGLTVEELSHYGMTAETVTVNTYEPAVGWKISNEVCQMPLRDSSLKAKTYIQLGTGNGRLKKGLCYAGSGDAIGQGAYMPNDFQIDDGKPVLLLQGCKDCCKAWGEYRDRGVHFVGLQDDRVPSSLVAACVGRKVVAIPDCDAAGRTSARQHARQLQKAGVKCEVVDLAPLRNDKSGIRELLRTPEGSRAFNDLLQSLTRTPASRERMLISSAASNDYYEQGY
jgi:hypothetical protein